MRGGAEFLGAAVRERRSVRMVLCRVFCMFGTMFVACFVASIGRIMWPVDKSYSGMVSGQKLTCTGAAKELSGTSGCGGASSGTL